MICYKGVKSAPVLDGPLSVRHHTECYILGLDNLLGSDKMFSDAREKKRKGRRGKERELKGMRGKEKGGKGKKHFYGKE